MIADTKKYIGKDMGVILDKIRMELGRDAIIFKSSSKKTGFNGTSRFEVVAGRDSNPWKTYKPKKINIPTILKRDIPILKNNQTSSFKSNHEKTTTAEITNKQSLSSKENASVISEIKELKTILKTIQPELQKNENELYKKIRSHLSNNGADLDTIKGFINQLNKLLGKRIKNINFSQLIVIAKKLLEKIIDQNIKPKEKDCRINILVGPTGAGKTTTLAKLAAIDSLKNKKNVILISLDSYKLGAYAQLKAYADILSVPFYKASSNEDILRVIKVLPKETKLFIDTSGTSPMNLLQISKLAKTIKGLEDCNISLVLSASSQLRQIEAIHKNFSVTGFKNTILTKIDEISHFGHLLPFLQSKNSNFSYLTNGQEVPRDIMNFSSFFIVDKILQVNF